MVSTSSLVVPYVQVIAYFDLAQLEVQLQLMVYNREYAAETISIFAVQVVMGFIAQKTTHRLLDAVIVIMLYPLSLVLVVVLEQIGLN